MNVEDEVSRRVRSRAAKLRSVAIPVELSLEVRVYILVVSIGHGEKLWSRSFTDY